MIADVGLHLLLEAIGACAAGCLIGRCEHRHHRVAVWLVIALISSVITVIIVG